MDVLWNAITEWLKGILVSGILSNLSGMFDSVNEKVSDISTQVGMTPQAWNSSIFNMVHNLSENVVMPVAGVILAFVMTLELVQILMDKNNFHDIETVVFFRWIFKTACAILIVTNTWDIVMGIFDVDRQGQRGPSAGHPAPADGKRKCPSGGTLTDISPCEAPVGSGPRKERFAESRSQPRRGCSKGAWGNPQQAASVLTLASLAVCPGPCPGDLDLALATLTWPWCP